MDRHEKEAAENVLRSMYAMKAGYAIRNAEGFLIWYNVQYEREKIVEKILSMLPSSLASVLRLVYCEGATVEDVSNLTGDIPFRVRNNLYRGLKRFVELWKLEA